MPAAIHRPGWKRRRNRLPTGAARCYRLGVETGTASCFAPLAADRLQRRPFASPTSPLKTRVRGFCRSASGRFSSQRRKTHAIATGSEPCAYKTASGRGKWPNRDPLGELGFETINEDAVVGSSDSVLRLAEILEGPNLYECVRNSPVGSIDLYGLGPDPKTICTIIGCGILAYEAWEALKTACHALKKADDSHAAQCKKYADNGLPPPPPGPDFSGFRKKCVSLGLYK
jgi:hypothetical protein